MNKTRVFQPSARSREIKYAIRDVVVEANKIKKQGHNITHLNIGDPNVYDFDTPEHIRKAAVQALNSDHNGYSPSEGVPELREAIREKETSDGRNLGTEDILVTAGVTEGLQMLFANLDGKSVLIPAPAYPPYTTYAKFNGVEPVEYPTLEEDNWQPDIDFIRTKLKEDKNQQISALSIINPNNPTGAFYTEKTVKELMEIAGEYNLMVISDEIYDRVLYDREIVKPGIKNNSDIPMIILNGISKVYFAPGWRIGYMAFRENGELTDFRESISKQARARLCPNTPLQYGYKAALDGSYDFLDKYLTKLRQRRDYSVKRINQIPGLSTRVPEGAFYMFPKISNGAGDDYKFVMDILHSCHVLFVHGSGFSENTGKGHFRMVFLPDLKKLEKGFDRIERYLEKNPIN